MEKKEKVVIHIGMYKTGTTSIQESLSKQGEGEDYCYFNFANPNHVQFCKLFMGKRFPLYKLNNTKDAEIKKDLIKTKKRFEALIKQCKHETMILSAECITDMREKELEESRDFLSNFFKEIKIVAYVREPISYIESAFQQVIKGGKDQFDIERQYPRYYDRFRKFDNVFGEENVNLWLFEPESFIGKDIVKDFSFRLNININETNISRVNDSLPKNVVSLMYIMNKFEPLHYRGPRLIKENTKIGSILKERLCENTNRKMRFSIKILESIIDDNRKDISWMENRIKNSLMGEFQRRKKDVQTHFITSETELMHVEYRVIQKMIDEIGNYRGLQNMKFHESIFMPEEIARLYKNYRLNILKEIS